MAYFTVQIQAGNEDGTIWQAIEPAETVHDDGPADQLALDVIANQNVLDLTADGGPWRIAIWAGHDADTSTTPTYTLDDQKFRDSQADTLDRWEDARADQ